MVQSVNFKISQSNIVIFAATAVLIISVIVHLVGIFISRDKNQTLKNWLNWIGGIFIIIAIILLYVAYITKCIRSND
jgi:putative Mn2+ efflux pump MntP